jgi:hypothetical protein
MAQKYNIYINQKALIITSDMPQNASGFQLIEAQDFDFLNFYKSLSKSSKSIFYIVTKTPKKLFKAIKDRLKVIEAAGGLVMNEQNKYLFIKRNGKWDLPKGKLELNEKKKDAAVREVEEECGITVKKLDKKLLKTYHIYELKGKVVLKISHWYAMHAKSNQKLVPQLEEGITEVKWLLKKTG